MIKQNRGSFVRLSMMITSDKKNIFLKHFFFSVKEANIPEHIPSYSNKGIKNIAFEAGFYSQV